MKFPVRLDRYISQSTDYSRKDVKRLLKSGEVTVNGEVALKADIKVNEGDDVCFGEEQFEGLHERYFMLHKPEGYVSANRDRDHMTVMDLLDEPRKDNLSVAGRLDIDTTGLVLLTDDGQWLHQVISPKHLCEKVYVVETDCVVTDKQRQKLEQGIFLKNEKTRTAPAKVEVIEDCVYRVTITEGRYHQVKRMFAALENHVEKLHRESIGGIILDPDLQPGEYRPLTDAEVALIK
ncbi:16S rRNA pseudouridine(516) synthase RsuA [Pleionea sp. CnH1-48]|uniref:16S rRNA pseudouridine(516) synthase RsuA n=1 Tax=Pleionea sp. CnH1-48 TaxID=2954494 RepID=UPI002097132B|nr:16S rRNA pseudouridine(516) synthase RsuA [Pleionea sp. CnH1-48]MCO7224547.1 16S rRNA pseudouridine(516) synthase RsuA [Pleionea sp. CnH1-48]